MLWYCLQLTPQLREIPSQICPFSSSVILSSHSWSSNLPLFRRLPHHNFVCMHVLRQTCTFSPGRRERKQRTDKRMSWWSGLLSYFAFEKSQFKSQRRKWLSWLKYFLVYLSPFWQSLDIISHHVTVVSVIPLIVQYVAIFLWAIGSVAKQSICYMIASVRHA
jgi:hypothetical protein